MKKPSTPKEFTKSLDQPGPGSIWPDELKALWWDAKGNWEKAHELVDSLSTPTAIWIHAYLHRKEGDQWNAEYWYRRARKPIPEKSLEAEFEDIVMAMIIS
ncbi:hypothetical protein [uncultured Muriicola sp.]|uniref:hypothetical protein n=1 Tax=uncultured Muriicola sp. TaxID=1583102 RepID=UPI00262C618E|nr:hypothetical protein [uncultured Muriicola sp.]